MGSGCLIFWLRKSIFCIFILKLLKKECQSGPPHPREKHIFTWSYKNTVILPSNICFIKRAGSTLHCVLCTPDWTVQLIAYRVHDVPARFVRLLEWGGHWANPFQRDNSLIMISTPQKFFKTLKLNDNRF